LAVELTEQERNEILDLYQPLRVADVSDGMDWMMRHDLGLMDRNISPLYRPVRFCGLAKTVRYVPTNRTVPTMSPQEYDDFVDDWYTNVGKYPFEDLLEPGDALVVDASNLDVGLLGSNNVLDWINRGVRGVVTNGGCRDTDEVIKQGCPVFSRYCSRTMVQGRIEFASMMEPVGCGGVKVSPGDVIVADGDGVIAVPLEAAHDVAKWARRELDKDKVERRRMYEDAGMSLDETVS
jgi:4-hydroxy-4-methyl-2-oxoglutarate aldolase